MKRKNASGMMLTLLLIGVLISAFDIRQVEAEPETVYIRADGSVEGTTDISTVDNVTYTFIDNINDSIIIERDNIIVDGAGHLLHGTGSGCGIDLWIRSNVTIKNIEIRAFHYGIYLGNSSSNTVSGNTISNNNYGINLASSSNNTVSGNTVSNNNPFGVHLASSSNNTVSGNTISNNNQSGIFLTTSSNNTVSGNNITNSDLGVTLWASFNNTVSGNTITNSSDGVYLYLSSNNTVSGNTITNSSDGVQLSTSPNNTVSGNTITNSTVRGVYIPVSSNNTVSGNTITNNDYGVWLDSSSDNWFYHNNFIDNNQQVYIQIPGDSNFWDNGYPSGGNYWSNYNGTDFYSGQYQNEPDSDGIGDTPYVIDGNNQDNYPFMGPWQTGATQVVSTESTDGSYHPSLCVDSSGNVHIAWHDRTDLACGTDWDVFYKCFVVGSGWTNTTVVSTESNGTSAWPSLAVGPDGTIHIAWHDNTTDYAGSGSDWDIFYKRYEIGVGWKNSTEVVSTESNGSSVMPSLAVGPDGTIHIAWHDYTNYTGCGTDADIFYKRYEVGVGWTSTEVVSTNSTANSFRPSLAVDSTGNVHIAWDDETDLACGNDADIFYKRYEVGVGWTSTEVVSTNSTLGSFDVSLAVDSSGNVHLAWHDDTDLACGNDRDIFYKSFLAGSGWTNTTVVSTESNASSWYPSLAVDSTGNVHIAWDDGTNYTGCGNDTDIFYKRYEVGLNWTVTQVVSTESTAASWTVSLAVDLARNVHIAWHDVTDYAGCGSDADIFYKYLRVHSTEYPWPMFRHNLRQTGYTESPAPNTNQTLWTFTTSSDVESSPAVADGMVFVGSYDGNVYALDQHTRALIWKYTTGGQVRSSPAVADGVVFVSSEDGKVYSLNQYTGVPVWNSTIGGMVYSSPAVAYGKVYVVSLGGIVYCLDASNGTHIWDYFIGNRPKWIGWSSPAVAYGKVYVGSERGQVYCLDASTGVLIWNSTIGLRVHSSPAVADGRVYVGSEEGIVHCLDASNGTHIWNYTTGGQVYSSPAVGDGMVFVGSYDGRVYALNYTGDLVWNSTTGGAVYSSPAVAYGMVFVGSNDGNVYALDQHTGVPVWKYTTGGQVYSSPAVADGVVFIGSNDNTVYAFGDVVRVPEDYPTIQEAIDEACTIIVAPGIYYESLVINKSLTIIGKTGSVTEFKFGGGGSRIAVTITDTSKVTVANILITSWDRGIFIDNSSDCKICDNIMSLMGESGIALEGENAVNNLICKNIFQDNTIAINLTESSTGNIICDNTISDNDVGIDMSNSDSNFIYHNNFVDNTCDQVYVSQSTGNVWDNGYPSGGNYWSDYEEIYPNAMEIDGSGIWDTPYEIDENNEDRYPLVKPFSGVGITNITKSRTVIGQGFNLCIDVEILNHGLYDEVSTVAVYANTTFIANRTITLKNRDFTTITFTWNTTGFPHGNYTIKAYATPVPDEIDVADNDHTDGWVVVTILGDANGDGYVNVWDLGLLSDAWLTDSEHPDYNANVDFSMDDLINVWDLGIMSDHWLESIE